MMSYPDDNFNTPSGQAPKAIPVEVRNFPAVPPKPRPTRTVTKTYILDPASINAAPNYQIAFQEPSRFRVFVKPWTASIVVTTEKPVNSPDVADLANHILPVGALILANDGANPWEFFGCDPLWINSLGTQTFVTVVKEYL